MIKKRRLTLFGRQVKEKLIDRNMTQKELAKMLKTSDAYLSMILYGERSGYKYIDDIKRILNIK